LLPPQPDDPCLRCATGTPAALEREALALVRRALGGLDDLRGALLALLDALGKGVAIVEVMWRVEPDGAVMPAALVPRWPGRFRFDELGQPRRADMGDPLEGAPLPARKFVVATFAGQQRGQAPGLGLAARAYWYSWFKRNNVKAWALYNERFGSPTVVARYPVGADDAERRRLLDVVDAVRQDAGVAMPEDVRLELLEATRGGSAETYRQLCEWCNDEISKIVLGQTLTTGEGRRSGSLALGQVHDAIRHEYIAADAALLEAAVAQLIRWVVDFNLGEDVAAPRWTIDTAPADRLEQDARLDRELIGLGLPLGVEYFYERYGRPRPTPGQATINYDDRNIFQYHLRYGVLTINEVRARMGLAPVPWGDTRAGEVAAPAEPPGSDDGAPRTAVAPPTAPDPGAESGRSDEDDNREDTGSDARGGETEKAGR